ncbi:MAG TPA: Npt1/Npt2 family nucleotide transporter, partial [Candidatus Eisenbacteria bacterium]|nr:Npt1/Npt2 family nucleotide transporter [Candidatus Eisenbacteria bacterium]
ADQLFEPLGPYLLMLVAAALLTVSMALANWVNTRERHAERPGAAAPDADKPLGREGGFKLVATSRYLLLIAALMIVVNAVNTTGEFILGKKVTEEARRASEAISAGAPPSLSAGSAAKTPKQVEHEFIGRFYGNFFFWVNLCTALVQLFVVSRVLKYIGVSRALFFLPLIALGGYSLIAALPLLHYIRIAKIVENSTDYSLQNTVRQALFLPTSREAKYKAKAAIDTFFVRIGDMTAAGVVFVGSSLALTIESFAMVNVGAVVVWLILVSAIARHYRQLAAATTQHAEGTLARG